VVRRPRVEASTTRAGYLRGRLIHLDRQQDHAKAWFKRVHEIGDAKIITTRVIYDSAARNSRALAVLAEGSPGSERFRAALFFCQKEINQRLQDHTRSQVWYVPDPERLDLLKRATNAATRRRLGRMSSFDLARERLRFAIIPETLLGVLWIQLAQVVQGGVAHRACESCGKWFEISPHDGRQQRRQFCNATCRVNSNRAM
jgi:hypothetical protein